jgi:hypothetical protein
VPSALAGVFREYDPIKRTSSRKEALTSDGGLGGVKAPTSLVWPRPR